MTSTIAKRELKGWYKRLYELKDTMVMYRVAIKRNPNLANDKMFKEEMENNAYALEDTTNQIIYLEEFLGIK